MTDYKELLRYIDPSKLDYTAWLNIGMALKEEGLGVEVWEEWSRRDAARYHTGECERKWKGFNGASNPVTGGTIVQLAKENGWNHFGGEGRELDWDDVISAEDGPAIVDKNWVEGRELEIPEEWEPAKQIIAYLEALFEAEECVGYVTRSYVTEGRTVPTKGVYDRTAGRLIQELSRCRGDVGAVLGDCDPGAGAWVRFNPLDGKGVKNENVTEFRFALVESDSLDLARQNAIIRELELPVAALVYSGGKSLHAIVRIEAPGYEEYKRRVDYLYSVCKKNGLDPDTQNRNPSRLSRLPGVLRNGKKQYLLATNIGKSSWNEWRDWIEDVSDDLPNPEALADVWNDLPPLSPPLIDGVLRQGHKMLLAGPSKAGKSYALIELCCAIAEGRRWFGFECTRGRVMYVNLELDRASCMHRFKDVYTALGWRPDNLCNIDIWNLRGKAVPMDKLAPKLIRRAARKDYIAIVIDPIYKVITGDENSADQMANFCNQFDKVAAELGCAVIYCHHHSKGAQAAKRSMDRASGSGVFARDPDALLDLIELELDENMTVRQENRAVCRACLRALRGREVAAEDRYNSEKLLRMCGEDLGLAEKLELDRAVDEARRAAKILTAWRVEGTLREYPKFQPVNLWFEYPVHRVDGDGILQDIDPEEDKPWTGRKGAGKKKSKRDEWNETLNNAFEALKDANGVVRMRDIVEYCDSTSNTIKKYIDNSGFLQRDANGQITRTSSPE